MDHLSHRDAINEAHCLVRMESDTMLRSEVRVLNELIVKHPDKTDLARAMLDMVMREIERRDAAKGVARS
jgi:hypothetical protein